MVMIIQFTTANFLLATLQWPLKQLTLRYRSSPAALLNRYVELIRYKAFSQLFVLIVCML